MPLYDRETKLCDILFHEPSAITVINRFGIYLGVGDDSVETVCAKHDVDTVFFLSIINTYLNEDYFPENILKSVNLKLIVDYLSKTDTYYEQFQLPNIERHFNSLVMHSRPNNNNNLPLLRKFFMQMKEELLANIRNDREVRFPLLLKLQKGREELSADDVALFKAILEDDGHLIEDKEADLLSFFIIHLRGDYDHNLCRAVVSAIFTLGKDINQNNRIRHRILRPLSQALLGLTPDNNRPEKTVSAD